MYILMVRQLPHGHLGHCEIVRLLLLCDSPNEGSSLVYQVSRGYSGTVRPSGPASTDTSRVDVAMERFEMSSLEGASLVSAG
jgi:hypothetical protein